MRSKWWFEINFKIFQGIWILLSKLSEFTFSKYVEKNV